MMLSSAGTTGSLPVILEAGNCRHLTRKVVAFQSFGFRPCQPCRFDAAHGRQERCFDQAAETPGISLAPASSAGEDVANFFVAQDACAGALVTLTHPMPRTIGESKSS
jgi:hypothetical protein